MIKGLVRCLTSVFLLAASTTLLAQQHPNVARGFDIGRSYQMNGIDNINLFNGSLTVTIPIGQRYHVNGGLQYGLTMVYSGTLWDTIQNDAAQNVTFPNRRSNAGIGWLLSLGRLFPRNTFPIQESGFWNYESPDGAIHAFQGLVDQTSGSFFTTDGSYLRLTINVSDRTVEFPDGTSQVFKEMNPSGPSWAPQTGTGVWRLTSINDRFGNAVSIGYGNTLANPEIWTINDGTRQQLVYFVTPPDASSTVTNFYDLMLDHVVLTTFGALAETSRTWRMAYDNQTLGSGNPPGRGSTFSAYYVPLLTAITLPPVGSVSQVYSMRRPDGTTYYNISMDSNMGNGALRGLQLPTKGWIEWDYFTYVFPGATEISISRTLAVTQRRTLSADRSPSETKTWTYGRAQSTTQFCTFENQRFELPPEQLVASVTSPELVTTVHYFSTFQQPGSQPCALFSQFNPDQYALPFTVAVSDTFNGEQRFLSQETYLGTPSILTAPGQYRATGGTLQRSEWTFYRDDMPGMEDSHVPESAHATKYDDDMHCEGLSNHACYGTITRYGPDGAGHYRQSSTGGNFDSGNFATAFTNYIPFPSGAWLLNLFTEQCSVEETAPRGAMPTQTCDALASSPTNLAAPFVKQYCFDGNGFLTRQRTLAGTAAGPHDLLAVFSQQNGNVTQEDYFGGDGQTLGTGSVCNAALPATSEYQILHTYSNGSLAQSHHRPASGDPIIFDANNTIEPNTGLVSASTDQSGLTTSFTYDTLGRLTQISRPGEAAVSATYTEATGTSPATVVLEQASIDAGTSRSTTIFDGLGRVAEEQRLMPSGTARRQTSYTGSGWTERVSQWEATPSHFTVFSDFDPFGRAKTITAPDQTSTTATKMTYFGVRRVERSVSVGETLTGSSVSQALATTVESYDRAGRLIKVEEPDGISTAAYGYDAANRLVSVTMTDPVTTQQQTRGFSYDGRGFLTSEQHPENGTTFYKSFDSRGHAGRKLAGSSLSPFDLRYEYDSLERLKTVYQLLNRIDPPSPAQDLIQPVKQFFFATANDGTNLKQGKLETATRKNYLPSPLGTIDVTETYKYADSAGRLTDKTTEVTGSSGTVQKYEQSYTYNDAGLFSEIKYPTCPNGNCATSTSMIASILPTYQNGLLRTIPDFTTAVTYDLNGMVTGIAHAGTAPVTDSMTADPNKLPRPARIQFNTYDPCVSPLISLPATQQVTSGSPNLQVTILNTPSPPLTWQWLFNGTLIAGETGSVCCTAAASNGTYTARLINSCGKGEASTVVSTCSSPTVTVSPQTSNFSTTAITLTATPSGCQPFTYQWYVGDSGVTTTPTGTNSPSLTVSPTQTTHYWVRVTNGSGSGNSNTAIVIVTPATPGPLTANFFAAPNPMESAVIASWGASSGADHYELQRLDHGVWTPITVNAPAVSFSFTPPLNTITTYVFRVRAIDSSGSGISAWTANDLATTMSFTVVQTNVTVAFDHFEQIRTAINAILAAQNGAALTWRQILDNAGFPGIPVPDHNVPIYAAHIRALRSAMDAALANVQVATAAYTDSLTSPTPIKALHITQLQQRAQ